MSNAVCTWDFTLKSEGVDKERLLSTLKKIAKKWCFQLEKSDSGYEHYQGRLSLKVRERLNGIKRLFTTEEMPEIHLSVTSTENSANMFYVLKPDTKIDGPWKDDDKVLYIPSDVRDITLWPWQQKVKEDLEAPCNNRTINVVVDVAGKGGKGTIKKWLCCRGLAQNIPSMIEKSEDIMAWVMSFEPAKMYMMDMPRAMNQKEVAHLYAALESIKDGYACDKRYHGKEVWFEPPRIWVFSNELPKKEYLTADRWKVWTINHLTKELIKVKF